MEYIFINCRDIRGVGTATLYRHGSGYAVTVWTGHDSKAMAGITYEFTTRREANIFREGIK